jgi:hypothetical protein
VGRGPNERCEVTADTAGGCCGDNRKCDGVAQAGLRCLDIAGNGLVVCRVFRVKLGPSSVTRVLRESVCVAHYQIVLSHDTQSDVCGIKRDGVRR